MNQKHLLSKYFVHGLLTYCLIFSFLSSDAQSSKKELQKKKEQLNKEIEYTNKLLEQTQQNKSLSVHQLSMLNKKISIRTELINTINDEINGIEGEIGVTSGNIEQMEDKLKMLKREYAKMIYVLYKNQSAYDRLVFIFSAGDFNQAYQRLRYLQEYGQYRKKQYELIVKTQQNLNNKKAELQETREEKSGLLNNEEKEKKNLSGEKQEQVVMLAGLSQKEKKLRADLKDKQKASEKLERMIEEIIRKEIAAAKEAEKKKAAAIAAAKKSSGKKDVKENKPEAKTNNESYFTATPEALKLSNDFESNRGKLPWPVDQGLITSSYGRHPHPLWHDVEVNNNGINITSHRGSNARAVFDGTVTGVISIPGAGYAVIVRHGEFLSVYSNLDEVRVHTGDKIITKQLVGSIHTSEDDAKTELHFEIWKGNSRLDPEGWIAAKRS